MSSLSYEEDCVERVGVITSSSSQEISLAKTTYASTTDPWEN